MNIQVTFKNFNHTPSLNEQILKKTKKIEKLLSSENANIHWYCWVDKNSHFSSIQISGFQGPKMIVSAKADSLYKTFDMVINKAQKRLIKKKNDIQHNAAFEYLAPNL